VPDLRELWGYINPFMLYGRHMGFRGDFEKRLADRDPKAVDLFENMEEVKKEASEFMKIRAVWQFFEAAAEGDSLHLFAPGAQEPRHTFRFGRQRQGDFLCLADYVLPAQSGKRDHLALFVVTAGEGIRDRSEKSKEGRLLLQIPRPAGSGNRDSGSVRRMAASAHSRRLGLP